MPVVGKPKFGYYDQMYPQFGWVPKFGFATLIWPSSSFWCAIGRNLGDQIDGPDSGMPKFDLAFT
jgi:hypothetical protein